METANVRGMDLSKMTLGTVQLGLDYGMANREGIPPPEKAKAILDAALAGGVNCFDTAADYGTSEEVVGGFFKGRPGSGATLVTKCRVDPGQGTTAADIQRQFTASAERSLERLGLARLPLLLLHIPQNLEDYGDAVPAAFAGLKAAGLIERAGVSVYTARDVDNTLKHEVFEAVQLPMSVLDRRLAASGHLARLAAAGYAVFVRSVFLQGLFFLDTMPAGLESAAPFVAALRRLAKQAGCSVAQLALAYVRDLPGVASLVLGAENEAQVRENVALMEAPPLPAPIVDEIEQLAPPIEEWMAVITGGRV